MQGLGVSGATQHLQQETEKLKNTSQKIFRYIPVIILWVFSQRILFTGCVGGKWRLVRELDWERENGRNWKRLVPLCVHTRLH